MVVESEQGKLVFAYKFRAASAADHIFDILLNRRLYCADWQNLNDPVEGIFAFGMRADEADGRHDGRLRQTHEAMQRLRVCSLAGTFDCHLLWSHYAAGFNGVAIEVELPDDPSIRPVTYRGVFGFLNLDGHVNPDVAAREVLFSKYSEWQYEEEIRILHDAEFFPLEAPIRRVIVGHRLNGALLEAIQIVCENQGIEVCRVGIGDEGLDADYLPPSRFSVRAKEPETCS